MLNVDATRLNIYELTKKNQQKNWRPLNFIFTNQ